MTITMQGTWSVSVKSKSAAFPQRFVISGADSGNGAYAGVTSTPPVTVTGDGWAVTVQHDAGIGWVDSDDQLKFPTASATEYRVDIESDDGGGLDQDFNDLVLTCAMAKTTTDFLLFGNVSYYGPGCTFNPCARRWVVIDSSAGLLEALKNPVLRKPIELLYPDRLVVKVPPIGPTPPPPPFRPLVLPLQDETALPPKLAQVLTVESTEVPAVVTTKAKRGQAPAAPERIMTVSSSRSIALSHAAAKVADFDQLAVAGIFDKLFRYCETGALPGVVLRFLEYDRTAAELAGGAYSGTGDRDTLGASATDRNGNYVFRFRLDIGDIAEEVTSDVAGGENVVVQARPDVIAQLLDTVAPIGFCYESAPYWNVPLLRRIDICVPKGCVGRLPTACQGSDAIQAIGNIALGARQPDLSRIGFNNTLGPDGRITARNTLPNVPQARCAAWAGALDFYACFLDQAVATYTVRWRRAGQGYQFFQEPYSHRRIANINLPNYNGDPVGPFSTSLHVDGGAVATVPAYVNIESDPAWVLNQRDRKAVVSSWLYGPAATPGPVKFRIDGYNAAGFPVASDSLWLYIDNSTPTFDIKDVQMLTQLGDDCALFTLPAGQLDAPLTVTFRAIHDDVVFPSVDSGFFDSYGVSVRKGNVGNVAITPTPPGQIAGAYTHGDDLVCSEFRGTRDDPTADALGYVVADIAPTSGGWLNADEPFCTFSVKLGCSVRVTNGYNSAAAGYGPTEYLLGIQQ